MGEDPFIGRYVAAVRGEEKVPSRVAALYAAFRPLPSSEELRSRLSSIDGVTQVELHPEGADARAKLHFGDEVAEYRILSVDLEEALGNGHHVMRGIDPLEEPLVRATRAQLGVECFFGDRPLFSFHRQLQVLAALAPDLVAFQDLTGAVIRSAAWLRDVAAAPVPPPPTTLYTIHFVVPDEGEREGWIHTHGLDRCGILELEALMFDRDLGSDIGTAVNTAAALMLDNGVPPPWERFEIGQDIAVAWAPWEEVVKDLDVRLGGNDDRDEYHSHPSAVLFADGEDGSMDEISALVPALKDNPLLYRSTLETERAAMLARTRLSLFKELFERLGGVKGWEFQVKLGVPTTEGERREHIWFQVHGFDGDKVEATCMNSPYFVPALEKGQRGAFDLGWLSDWTLHGPEGTFNPDTVQAIANRGHA